MPLFQMLGIVVLMNFLAELANVVYLYHGSAMVNLNVLILQMKETAIKPIAINLCAPSKERVSRLVGDAMENQIV